MADTEASQAHDEMEKEQEELDKQMKELEENPPEKLEDWPDGKAKYRTFGGPEAEAGYDEGATKKLGTSEVRHFEDGRVEVSGEEVDNPEDFKGDPIPLASEIMDEKAAKGEERSAHSDSDDDSGSNPERPESGSGPGDGDEESSG